MHAVNTNVGVIFCRPHSETSVFFPAWLSVLNICRVSVISLLL